MEEFIYYRWSELHIYCNTVVCAIFRAIGWRTAHYSYCVYHILLVGRRRRASSVVSWMGTLHLVHAGALICFIRIIISCGSFLKLKNRHALSELV